MTHDIVQYHLAEYSWQVNRIAIHISRTLTITLLMTVVFNLYFTCIYIYNFNFKYIDCMNNMVNGTDL